MRTNRSVGTYRNDDPRGMPLRLPVSRQYRKCRKQGREYDVKRIPVFDEKADSVTAKILPSCDLHVGNHRQSKGVW